MVGLILLILAFLLCLIQSFRYSPSNPWPWYPVPHLGWFGVAMYFLSLILSGAGMR